MHVWVVGLRVDSADVAAIIPVTVISGIRFVWLTIWLVNVASIPGVFLDAFLQVAAAILFPGIGGLLWDEHLNCHARNQIAIRVS